MKCYPTLFVCAILCYYISIGICVYVFLHLTCFLTQDYFYLHFHSFSTSVFGLGLWIYIFGNWNRRLCYRVCNSSGHTGTQAHYTAGASVSYDITNSWLYACAYVLCVLCPLHRTVEFCCIV